MNIKDRIKYLRKEILNKTQSEFGKLLGVSRSVIANIELDLLANPKQKEPLYRLICSEFKVNYDWLIDGEGEMFIETDETILNQLSEAYSLTVLEQKLLLSYLNMDVTKRVVITDFIRTVINVFDKEESMFKEPEILKFTEEEEKFKINEEDFALIQDEYKTNRPLKKQTEEDEQYKLAGSNGARLKTKAIGLDDLKSSYDKDL